MKEREKEEECKWRRGARGRAREHGHVHTDACTFTQPEISLHIKREHTDKHDFSHAYANKDIPMHNISHTQIRTQSDMLSLKQAQTTRRPAKVNSTTLPIQRNTNNPTNKH